MMKKTILTMAVALLLAISANATGEQFAATTTVQGTTMLDNNPDGKETKAKKDKKCCKQKDSACKKECKKNGSCCKKNGKKECKKACTKDASCKKEKTCMNACGGCGKKK